MADAINADATCSHGLQQGALGMEAGAVDHIGQQHPREQRPRLESEAGLSGVEHI